MREVRRIDRMTANGARELVEAGRLGAPFELGGVGDTELVTGTGGRNNESKG